MQVYIAGTLARIFTMSISIAIAITITFTTTVTTSNTAIVDCCYYYYAYITSYFHCCYHTLGSRHNRDMIEVGIPSYKAGQPSSGEASSKDARHHPGAASVTNFQTCSSRISAASEDVWPPSALP